MSGDPPMELYVEGLTRSALSQKLQFAAACGLRVAAPLASSCRGKRRDQPA